MAIATDQTGCPASTWFDKLTNRFDKLTNRFDRLTNRFDKLTNQAQQPCHLRQDLLPSVAKGIAFAKLQRSKACRHGSEAANQRLK
jgi:hypothetical protein